MASETSAPAGGTTPLAARAWRWPHPRRRRAPRRPARNLFWGRCFV